MLSVAIDTIMLGDDGVNILHSRVSYWLYLQTLYKTRKTSQESTLQHIRKFVIYEENKVLLIWPKESYLFIQQMVLHSSVQAYYQTID